MVQMVEQTLTCTIRKRARKEKFLLEIGHIAINVRHGSKEAKESRRIGMLIGASTVDESIVLANYDDPIK